MTNSVGGGPRIPPSEDAFWRWFVANEARLFSFEDDLDAVFEALAEQLHQVHPDLVFEFGPVEDGKREFVISAGGIRSAFPAVESLHEHAPACKRWTFVKFRPPRSPLMPIRYGGKEVAPEDVHYMLAKDGDRVGVVLFFDRYTEAEHSVYGNIGFLLLDMALGEYAVEAELGFVEFRSRESPYFERSSPFQELAEHLEDYLARRDH